MTTVEKHCESLKSIDKKRYFMCLGSKLSVEGNWRQQGAKVLEFQQSKKTSSASKKPNKQSLYSSTLAGNITRRLAFKKYASW